MNTYTITLLVSSRRRRIASFLTLGLIAVVKEWTYTGETQSETCAPVMSAAFHSAKRAGYDRWHVLGATR